MIGSRARAAPCANCCQFSLSKIDAKGKSELSTPELGGEAGETYEVSA